MVPIVGCRLLKFKCLVLVWERLEGLAYYQLLLVGLQMFAGLNVHPCWLENVWWLAWMWVWVCVVLEWVGGWVSAGCEIHAASKLYILC